MLLLGQSVRSRFTPLPLGLRGERYAAKVLRRKGFRILLRGKRNRFGELDIIAVDERDDRRTLVFVEVKTRHNTRGGSPAEAVTPVKQRRLSRSAMAFLKTHDMLDHPARFDVVSIIWPRESKKPSEVKHIENAFELIC